MIVSVLVPGWWTHTAIASLKPACPFFPFPTPLQSVLHNNDLEAELQDLQNDLKEVPCHPLLPVAA